MRYLFFLSYDDISYLNSLNSLCTGVKQAAPDGLVTGEKCTKLSK